MSICVHAPRGSRLCDGDIFRCGVGLERGGAEGELIFGVAVFGLGYAGVACGWGAGVCHYVERLPVMGHGVASVVVRENDGASSSEDWFCCMLSSDAIPCKIPGDP